MVNNIKWRIFIPKSSPVASWKLKLIRANKVELLETILRVNTAISGGTPTHIDTIDGKRIQAVPYLNVEPSTSTDANKNNKQAESIILQDGELYNTCMNYFSGTTTPKDEKSSRNIFLDWSCSAMTHVSQQDQFVASTPITADENIAPNISEFNDETDERAENTLASQPSNDSGDTCSKCIFCDVVRKRSGSCQIRVRLCNSQQLPISEKWLRFLKILSYSID
ncbi:unnamed protein product [Psylliodes chrysocephalus]|uniref:Uncharacterized protein n=1 Tax=Psylliodes chrysocephalus TaxID=3402493 RepID=A0A9P0D1S7_9CUCU|nr:unnamed protein product [Psylliodes chrysocephala]